MYGRMGEWAFVSILHLYLYFVGIKAHTISCVNINLSWLEEVKKSNQIKN
jgi:hypothetical protein